ncbi:hypothetical protein [Trinickia sp.]|uniref:hypothetical protein n=1 Tax=Trinickia sp. TaxID=2571163 RepID=UPI002D7EB38F|nr:hypothetical protein [Trinickia sp.]
MTAVRGPFTNSVGCNNTALDPDPAVGYAKSCYTTTTTAPPPPTVTLTASPASITSGSSSTLTVTSTNAVSCTGPVTSTSGSVSVSPTTTTTYTETCTGAAGTTPATAKAIVTVTAAQTGFTPPALVNPVSPKSYGAKCDGVTDDTNAFQSAVNAGDVLVPAGTCVINGTIWITTSNKHVQCQGTTLKRTTGDAYNMWAIGSTSYNNGVNYDNDSIVGCNFIGANTAAPTFTLGTRQFDIPVETYGRVNNFFLAGNSFKQFFGQSMFQTYSPTNGGSGDYIAYNTFASCGYYGPVFDAHTNGYIGHNQLVDCAIGVENDNTTQATGGNIIEYNTIGVLYGYGAPDMSAGAMLTGGVTQNVNYSTNIVRNNTISGTSNGLGAHGVQPSRLIIGTSWGNVPHPAQYQNNTCGTGCVFTP